LLIKSLAESIPYFSLLTEIELAVRALLASPLDLKKPVFRLKHNIYSASISSLAFLLEERHQKLLRKWLHPILSNHPQLFQIGY
jgi:hypothetical protein